MKKSIILLLSSLFVATALVHAVDTPEPDAPIAPTSITAEELARVEEPAVAAEEDGDDFNDEEDDEALEGSAETAHTGKRKSSGYGMYQGKSGY